MKKALLAAGGLGLGMAIWFGYFWLDERRRWAQPIQVRDSVPAMDRFRRAL